MTDYGLKHNKFKKAIINDIDPRCVRLYDSALKGSIDYNYYAKLFINRDEFMKLKETDPVIACIWSFGNDFRTFFFSDRNLKIYHAKWNYVINKDESELQAMGFLPMPALTSDDYKVNRRTVSKFIREKYGDHDKAYTDEQKLNRTALKLLAKDKEKPSEIENTCISKLDPIERLNNIENLSIRRIQPLEKLDIIENLRIRELQPLEKLDIIEGLSIRQLEPLQRLDRIEGLSIRQLQPLQTLNNIEDLCAAVSGILETHTGDYAKVTIPEGAVVYIDPPYKESTGYTHKGLDYEALYNYIRNSNNLCIISEYSMPEDFVEVYSLNKSCSLQSYRAKAKATVEKLFVHASKLELYRALMNNK